MKYTIVVDTQSRTNPSDDKKEISFEIEELRKKGDVHDDLIIENGQAKVIRRIALSQYNVTNILKDEIVEELGELKIPLFEGNTYIYIKDQYNNQMCAEYIIKSDFTDTYVTNLQMNSEIEQTTQSIDLSVNKKLEEYSTTKEMQSEIKIQADEIKSIVSKKVGEDEIISKINQSSEEISIDANKISLQRKRN